jgi:isopenicillin N synthase-like dioxygenase
VVNIGDLMARWTNDRWRSTLHRVVDPPDPSAAAARRQSMPYFQNANWSAEISCLATCLEPGEHPRHAPVLAGPRLMSKFRRSVSSLRPRSGPGAFGGLGHQATGGSVSRAVNMAHTTFPVPLEV